MDQTAAADATWIEQHELKNQMDERYSLENVKPYDLSRPLSEAMDFSTTFNANASVFQATLT